MTSRRVAAEAGREAAARPLLLPHDGRPLPRGLPPPRRAGHRALRPRRSTSTARCGRCGGSPPISRGATFNIEFVALGQPPQGDPRRDRTLRASSSARCSSTRSPRSSKTAASRPTRARRSCCMLAMTGVTQVMALEEALGVTGGHAGDARRSSRPGSRKTESTEPHTRKAWFTPPRFRGISVRVRRETGTQFARPGKRDDSGTHATRTAGGRYHVRTADRRVGARRGDDLRARARPRRRHSTRPAASTRCTSPA